MSINKYIPHILVLPEDDANRQIAKGFVRDLDGRFIQVVPVAGGWKKVVEQFTNHYAHTMERFPKRMMALIIDFDQSEDRFNYVRNQIPKDLKNRVFILGVLSEPEKLKKDTEKSFEDIGKSLAKDCVNNTNELWGHDLLKHNETELNRMIKDVKPLLFN